MEKPFKGRAIIRDVFNGVEVAIPVKKDWVFIVCGSIVLFALTLPGYEVVKNLHFAMMNKIDLDFCFTLGALILLLAIAVNLIRIFIWLLIGKEVYTFTPYQITLYKDGLFLATPKNYSLQFVKRFHILTEVNPFFNLWGSIKMSYEGYSMYGAFSFDYGLKTVKFGSGIYEAEAVMIFELLKSKGLLSEENILI